MAARGRVSGEEEFYPVGERVQSAGHLVPVHTTSSAKWLRVPVGQRVIVVPCPSHATWLAALVWPGAQ
jgi:hypothetical protein